MLWARGSFIPRTDHLLRLGRVLTDQPAHQLPPTDSQPFDLQPWIPS